MKRFSIRTIGGNVIQGERNDPQGGWSHYIDKWLSAPDDSFEAVLVIPVEGGHYRVHNRNVDSVFISADDNVMRHG